MSTALQTTNGSGALAMYEQDWRNKLDVIRQTVAKEASPAQLEMFLHIAGRYGLDPFLKEIYYSPQIGVIASRDGYLKVAQRDPNYDGITSCAVCANDTFEFDPVAPAVKHVMNGKDRGAVIGGYAICYHKQRRPVVMFAPMSEYRKNGPTWNQYPSAMICKVAEVLALKRQFAISGLVTEEEVHEDESETKSRQVESATTAKAAMLAERIERQRAKRETVETLPGDDGAFGGVEPEDVEDAAAAEAEAPRSLEMPEDIASLGREAAGARLGELRTALLAYGVRGADAVKACMRNCGIDGERPRNLGDARQLIWVLEMALADFGDAATATNTTTTARGEWD